MRKIMLTLIAVALASMPATALAQSEDGTVTVVHGVPDLSVDVYVNDALTLSGFEFGTVTDPLTLAAGDYDIDIRAAGADASDPAVLSETVTLPAGANATIEANLDGAGNPGISVWVNDISTTEAGDGRVTVRHTAAAPNVDVLVNDGVLFADVPNGAEGVADVAADTYNVKVTAAGDPSTVVLDTPLTIPEGTNVIVYAIGDLGAGSFTVAVQSIGGLHTAPSGVPSGTGGLAAAGLPVWLFVAMALGAALVAGGGIVAVRQRG